MIVVWNLINLKFIHLHYDKIIVTKFSVALHHNFVVLLKVTLELKYTCLQL